MTAINYRRGSFPQGHASAESQSGACRGARGNERLEAVRGCRRQRAIVAGANAEALNSVLQGAKAAVFGAVDYISLAGKKKGETIEVIFPASGTVIAPRPVMILNWSKQQDDAKRFVDYVLSDEGQKTVASVQPMPSRTDIPADRPLIGDLKILPIDADAVYAKRKDTLKSFGAIFAK